MSINGKKQEMEEPQYCKKIVFEHSRNPKVILGIILEDKEDSLIVETAKNKFTIFKRALVSINDTDIIFERCVNGRD